MRDVTDNRTGELGGIEVKRGRGRPRKEGAMSNAERQAAFRARRRANDVTVTKSLHSADDYAEELRLEVEALRAELAEAHETIDELNDELIPLRATTKRLGDEVDELNLQFVRLIDERDEAREIAKKGAAKSVTRNGNPVDFDFMLEIVARVRKARNWRQRHDIATLPGWGRFVGREATTEEMRRALWDAMTGDKVSVTKGA